MRRYIGLDRQEADVRPRLTGDERHPRLRLRHLGLTCALALLVVAAGVAGYMALEGWNFLDALYMTVITLTTVGFREVHPLSQAGRVFTMALALAGVGVLLYALWSVVQAVVEGELTAFLGRRAMREELERLHGHFILCGFGRVGEAIGREFAAHRVPFVVVDHNPEAVARARRRGYLVVEGDASQDEVLVQAGIHRARGLLAASDSDAGNTFIVLTAKALRPDLLVVARAAQPDSEPAMRRAGASRVVSPYTLAGRRMALAALQPLLAEFMDALPSRTGAQVVAELEVTAQSGLAGRTLAEALATCPGVFPLGLQRGDGQVVVAPPPSILLGRGDRLILLGREEELEAIRTPSSTSDTA